MIQILELFGGIGAPRKALVNLGIPIKSIDYVEIDQKAVDSYNAIFANDLKHKIQDVRGYNLKPDILIHGSPCQDISVAGYQRGADPGSNTRSSLMWETINIIKQMGVWKPRVVIWENVKNVISKLMIDNFNRYLEEMSKLGYTTNYAVLNAMDFGLPQLRKRVFTISTLDRHYFNFDALEKKPLEDINNYLEHFNVDEMDSKYIVTAPSMLNVIGKKPKNFNGYIKVIDTYCETITTKQNRNPNSGVIDLKDGRYRYLTERECWRLQGYDDTDFNAALLAHPTKPGKMNGALYKQAGNSIPIPILEAIYKELFKL